MASSWDPEEASSVQERMEEKISCQSPKQQSYSVSNICLMTVKSCLKWQRCHYKLSSPPFLEALPSVHTACSWKARSWWIFPTSCLTVCSEGFELLYKHQCPFKPVDHLFTSSQIQPHLTIWENVEDAATGDTAGKAMKSGDELYMEKYQIPECDSALQNENSSASP